MKSRTLSETHDDRLDGVRVTFAQDIKFVSKNENDMIPSVTIPKGTLGILTGGETKKAINDRIYTYLVVEVRLHRGNIRMMHLVLVRLEHLRFTWGDVN